MLVINLTFDFLPGGMERWIVEFSKALKRMGIDNYIVTPQKFNDFLFSTKDVDFVFVDSVATDNGFLNLFPYSFEASKKCLELIENEKDVVLVVHKFKDLPAACLVKKMTRVKIAYVLHNPPFGWLVSPEGYRSYRIDFSKYVAEYNLWKKFINYVDYFFSNSEWIASLYRRFENLHVVPLYAGSDHVERILLNNARGEKGVLSFNSSFILSVGSFEPRKRFDLLLKALSELKNQEYRCFIVGGRKDPTPYVELSKKLGLRSKVKFFSKIDESTLFNLYSNCYFYVHPANHEHLGIAVLEAMASKAPVIVQNNGGVIELMKHEYNGFHFREDDVRELAKYMDLLFEDRKLREKMALHSRRLASKFKWDYVAKTFLETIYRQDVKKKSFNHVL